MRKIAILFALCLAMFTVSCTQYTTEEEFMLSVASGVYDNIGIDDLKLSDLDKIYTQTTTKTTTGTTTYNNQSDIVVTSVKTTTIATTTAGDKTTSKDSDKTTTVETITVADDTTTKTTKIVDNTTTTTEKTINSSNGNLTTETKTTVTTIENGKKTTVTTDKDGKVVTGNDLTHLQESDINSPVIAYTNSEDTTYSGNFYSIQFGKVTEEMFEFNDVTVKYTPVTSTANAKYATTSVYAFKAEISKASSTKKATFKVAEIAGEDPENATGAITKPTVGDTITVTIFNYSDSNTNESDGIEFTFDGTTYELVNY